MLNAGPASPSSSSGLDVRHDDRWRKKEEMKVWGSSAAVENGLDAGQSERDQRRNGTLQVSGIEIIIMYNS